MSQVPDEPDPDTWPADSTSEGSKGKGPRRKRSRRKGSNSERVIKVPKETAPENLPTIKIIPAADDKKENPITDRQKPVEKLHGKIMDIYILSDLLAVFGLTADE